MQSHILMELVGTSCTFCSQYVALKTISLCFGSLFFVQMFLKACLHQLKFTTEHISFIIIFIQSRNSDGNLPWKACVTKLPGVLTKRHHH